MDVYIGECDFPAQLKVGQSCISRSDFDSGWIATRRTPSGFKQERFKDGNPNMFKWCNGEDVQGDDFPERSHLLERGIRDTVFIEESRWAEEHSDEVWRMAKNDSVELLGSKTHL